MISLPWVDFKILTIIVVNGNVVNLFKITIKSWYIVFETLPSLTPHHPKGPLF